MKTLNKLIQLLLITFVGASLVACSGGSTTATAAPSTEATASSEATAEATTGNSQLDKIIASGKLVVALSPDYPPMEFLDNDNNAIGSDVALAQYIADQIGVELEILTVDFSSTFVAVDSGKADLVISGLGWQAERAEQYELSIPYNDEDGAESSCQGLIVPSDKAGDYTTMEDFAGKTVAAQVNSLQEMYSKAQIPDVVIESVTDIGTGLMSLQSGKVDAVALSCELAIGYANSVDGISKAEPEFVISEEEMAGNVIACKKGETALMDKVNEILAQVNEQGLFVGWDEEAKAQAADLGIEFED